LELHRVIGNCFACQLWHACRKFPTPASAIRPRVVTDI